ncbi:TraR/DksA family transcriptional regulator [Kribbella shirazensis]|uniref:RNA polymerase-binding transcription factor DksA n=1 Tax=Kribbella shirazensis TaxID=1105143 RepID=A0A7X5VAR1_9ACTN|nr:TraR/DksA C4-type zinc finger protein [Kribbella shirazensis]NIK57776.1 RNA polymerase-binding transcription factor DksA [Kribbella shirazensis]
MTSRTNAGLRPEELAVLRALLLEQRAFRREQLAGIRRHANESSGEQAEELPVVEAGARAEVQGHLAVAARLVLADVEAALDRMETGHYGRCRACRATIDLPRLRICPQALHCAECHRLQETTAR